MTPSTLCTPRKHQRKLRPDPQPKHLTPSLRFPLRTCAILHTVPTPQFASNWGCAEGEQGRFVPRTCLSRLRPSQTPASNRPRQNAEPPRISSRQARPQRTSGPVPLSAGPDRENAGSVGTHQSWSGKLEDEEHDQVTGSTRDRSLEGIERVTRQVALAGIPRLEAVVHVGESGFGQLRIVP